MKTKTWIAPASTTPPSDHGIDLPCMMWREGMQPIGPLPLVLCMYKGVQLLRNGADFTIESEQGDTLIRYNGEQVTGREPVLELFMRATNLAQSFYEDLLREVVAETQTLLGPTKKS